MFFDAKADSLPILLSALPEATTTAPALATAPAKQALRHPDLPFVIGVDLGGTQTRAAVVREHEIIARVSQPTPAHDGPAAVIAGIVATIHAVLEMAEISITSIRGIGIGAPGPLNPHTGVVYEAPNLHGWHNVPLRDEVAKSFTVPIYLGHDATVAALAEYRYGAGREATDMVYMTVSTGIGGGIIIGGTIVEGEIGTAGEIGHIIIDLRRDAPRCGSGHIGCLEAIASGTALARDANALIAAGQGQGILAIHRELIATEAHGEQRTTAEAEAALANPLRARDVVEAAHRGDVEAQTMLADAATAIGIGCVNLVHSLNPAVIVIGGGVAHAADDLLFVPVRQTLTERAFARPAAATQIVAAQLGNDVGLIGAAAFVDYQQGFASSQRGPTTA